MTAVDSAIKEDMLRRIGADHVIDYAEDDFTRTGRRHDVIFNMVAGPRIAGVSPGSSPEAAI